MKRNTATMSVAQGIFINPQPQQTAPCCALKNAGNPYGTGIVAVLRLEQGDGRPSGKTGRRIAWFR
jgi:hypothetical protein